jgi:arylsulfatase A-like enzyme
MSHLSRRSFLASTASAALAKAQARTRPNIVIILADDQGWGDLSINGNTNLSTPNVDSLAKDGTLLERFFVCPVCAPTRAEFLTGRYHARGGVRGVSTGAERLNLDEVTIAETFRAAGYATGAFGKWHNGTQHPYHPSSRGFGEYYGFTSGHWGHYFSPELDHNGVITQGRGYVTDDLTDHAVQFIESSRSKPFFCYVPFNTPHSPMHVPDKFFDRFANKTVEMRARDSDREKEDVGMTRAALAMCENIDWNVGRILKKLDDLKLRDNTIVLYFSDNGPNSWRWNGGMKGRKGDLDEGGIRSPFLIRWPGKITAGVRVKEIAAAIDLLPTFADLAGVPLTSKKPLDGRSLKPLLFGSAKDWPDRMIFTLGGRNRVTVRTQQYRLSPDGQLFDMAADPAQRRNVAGEKPDVAAKLREAAAAWGREVFPLVGPDDRPYPVGYHKTTMLPARDGVNHGKIQRSSRHPNDSFFTNWTSREDSLTWDIEVGKAGNYVAEIYYTCPAADVGSTIELSFLRATLEAKITEAHDPPLMGKEADRVARTESYVKDFRPLRAGTFALPKGRGLLTLKATDIPGRQVADVRHVVLTLA